MSDDTPVPFEASEEYLATVASFDAERADALKFAEHPRMRDHMLAGINQKQDMALDYLRRKREREQGQQNTP